MPTQWEKDSLIIAFHVHWEDLKLVGRVVEALPVTNLLVKPMVRDPDFEFDPPTIIEDPDHDHKVTHWTWEARPREGHSGAAELDRNSMRIRFQVHRDHLKLVGRVVEALPVRYLIPYTYVQEPDFELEPPTYDKTIPPEAFEERIASGRWSWEIHPKKKST